jgi:hypothetical protein
VRKILRIRTIMLWDAVLTIGHEIPGSSIVCLTSSDPLDELDPSCCLFFLEACVSTSTAGMLD